MQLGIPICQGNALGTSLPDRLHIISPGLEVYNPMRCLEGSLVGIVQLLKMLLDARINICLALGLHMRCQDNEITDPNFGHDRRLSHRRDLLPRWVVQRHLPDKLPKVVRPMRCMVTERHHGLFVVPLKSDRDGAFIIGDLL
ncbi:hypothetical protein Tco_1350799 [Tanacetum coccineum]